MNPFCQLVSLLLVASASAQEIKSGLYGIDRNERGIKIETISGMKATLGKLHTIKLGPATLTATKNDNSEFHLDLPAIPAPAGAERTRLALRLGGHYIAVTSYSRKKDQDLRLTAHIPNRKAALSIAKELGIQPRLRVHPGHRFTTRLRSKRTENPVGQPLTLILEIENLGDVDLTFQDGGMQRGARNNQFEFLARAGSGYGKAIPDTGDPRNFGGISVRRTLKKGQVFRKEVHLERWFRLQKPDTYRVTGMFRMAIGANKDWYLRWDDFAIAECMVRVTPAAKIPKK